MIYVISDLHLGHANIIKYCNRPFATVDEMNSALIKNWNDIVKPEDTVYFLGDFALGPKEAFRRFTACLNGHKHFIFGNHDHISRSQVLEAGWESAQYQMTVEYKGYTFQLQHHPDTDVPADRILVYGHVHEKTATNVPHKSFCACVEVNDYKPVTLDYIIDNFEMRDK